MSSQTHPSKPNRLDQSILSQQSETHCTSRIRLINPHFGSRELPGRVALALIGSSLQRTRVRQGQKQSARSRSAPWSSAPRCPCRCSRHRAAAQLPRGPAPGKTLPCSAPSPPDPGHPCHQSANAPDGIRERLRKLHVRLFGNSASMA